MCVECLLFRTMLGPCWDHVGTMLGLALLPDELLRLSQHGLEPKVKVHVPGFSIFLDHVLDHAFGIVTPLAWACLRS